MNLSGGRVVLGLFTALVVTCPGQVALAKEAFTVRAAVREALALNPELRAADRQVEAAKARETQALALPNPNVALQVDQVPFQNLPAGNYLVGVTQPILPSGQREARIEAARLDTELADLDREILRRDVTARVEDAFVRLLFDQEGLALASVNAQAAQAQLEGTRARYRAGEVAQVEVLRAELDHNRSQRDVIVAQGRLDEARSRLNILLGRDALAKAEPPVPLGLVAGQKLPPLPALAKAALEHRVELRQAAAAIRRETVQRQLARSAIWTGTEVSASTGLVSGQPAFTSTLTLPIPVYRQQGEIAEAEANQARAEARRDALARGITLDVHQAYNEAVNAGRQVSLLATNYLPQARRLMDNAVVRYNAGEGTGLEVADARRAYRETNLELLRASLEYRQALVRLERAVGQDLISP